MAERFRLTGALLAEGNGECRKDARCVALFRFGYESPVTRETALIQSG